LLVLRGGRVGILFSDERRIPLPCFAGHDRISCQDTRVSTLWTPSGEHRPEEEGSPEVPASPAGGGEPGAGISPEQVEEFLRFHAEITSIPAADVVANHAFGLQQLAMMHLMQVPNEDGTLTEPRLDEAGIAIDALGGLVETLGDRLGHHHEELQQAVTELRLAFVELSQR
jgi:hypothetical protein